MKIIIQKSIGTGSTELSAFDNALYKSGTANYNLLPLSSVIPPNSEIIVGEDASKYTVPGNWGDRLYVVMAEQSTSVRGQEAWAGIGWVQDPESGKGLFVEHEGYSESVVREDITNSLTTLMETRGIDFGPINMEVIGGTCEDEPICALVIASYQVSDWKNNSKLIEEA